MARGAPVLETLGRQLKEKRSQRPSGTWVNSRLCGKSMLIRHRTLEQFEKVVQANRAIWLKTRDVSHSECKEIK